MSGKGVQIYAFGYVSSVAFEFLNHKPEKNWVDFFTSFEGLDQTVTTMQKHNRLSLVYHELDRTKGKKEKGPSNVRMVHKFVGSNNFRHRNVST